MRLSNGETLLQWPLSQHSLTAGWYYQDGTNHGAIDLAAKVGDPVYASEPGTVDWVQKWDGYTKNPSKNQSYGNLVRIKHQNYDGKPLQTLYAHLSSTVVKQGQKVQEGDLIGYAGNTGNSTGPHLHFEVRLNGKRTNPLVWLDNDFYATPGWNPFTYRSWEHPVEMIDEYVQWGIDVSRYQGTIDWEAAKNAGVKFAFLKTVSTNNREFGGLYIDPSFERNYAECKRLGIPVGAYYYTYAQDKNYADKELVLFKQAVTGKQFEMPLVVDVEDNLLRPLLRETLTDLVMYAADTIKGWGCYPMIYTYEHYKNNELNMNRLSVYDLWLADYRGKRPLWKHEIWQYSSKGKVNGVSGNVDLNYSYKDYEAEIKANGLNGFSVTTTTPDAPQKFYSITIEPMTNGDKNTVVNLAESLKLKYNVKEVSL